MLVNRILEWRALSRAHELYTGGPKRREELMGQPGLYNLLVEVRKAQLEAQVGFSLDGERAAVEQSLTELLSGGDDGERG